MQILRLPGYTSPVAFSPDGQKILCSEGKRNTLCLLDLRGQEIRHFGHTSSFLAAVFSPDGRYILSGSEDGIIRLWDCETSVVISRFQGHSYAVTSISFSPDGQQAVSGGTDGTVRIWKVARGEELRCWHFDFESRRTVHCVVFSPKGRYVLAAGQPRWSEIDFKRRPIDSIQMYDTAKLDYCGSWCGVDTVTSVAFFSNGKGFVSANADGTICAWDTRDHYTRRIIEGHTASVSTVAIMPNARILSASWDGTIRQWETETGRELHCLPAHSDGVYKLALSPDGRKFITAGQDSGSHCVCLWEL